MCGLITPKSILAAAPVGLSVNLLDQMDHFVQTCTEGLHQRALEELFPDVLRGLQHRFTQEERLIAMLEHPHDRAGEEMHLIQHRKLSEHLTNLYETRRMIGHTLVCVQMVHFFEHALPWHFSTADRALARRALAQAL